MSLCFGSLGLLDGLLSLYALALLGAQHFRSSSDTESDSRCGVRATSPSCASRNCLALPQSLGKGFVSQCRKAWTVLGRGLGTSLDTDTSVTSTTSLPTAYASPY